MNFTLWAPTAKTLDLCLDDRRLPMNRIEQGWWAVDAPVSSPETAYRFSIDGGPPLPDPFSRWQPDGVHGKSWRGGFPPTSRHAAFRPKPLDAAIIYELHVGTFSPEGNYLGLQNKLPHLVALGVTHLELMPLATFPGRRGWGYDGVYLFAPHPAYGTPEELVALIESCHRHGLAVILDVVYNHFGPDGNYLASFGPAFTSRCKTPWGEAINYDGAHSDAMRQLVLDNATMWLRDYGFDGLRLDAVHAIFDTRAIHILEELGSHVRHLGKELRREFVLIAESDLNDPRLVRSVEAGGYGLDAHWADDFHHALHRFFTGESDGYYADFSGLEDVATALRHGYVYHGQYSAFRQRSHGRAPDGVAPQQLVVCAQNHDQIGNRALGERLSQLLSPAQLKAVAALLLLSPYVPLLFQGEEWGATTPFLYFTDHQNKELGQAVTKGRQEEFATFALRQSVPDPQTEEAFARSQLRWEELQEPAHAELLEWHRSLIAIRARVDSAPCEVNFDGDANWLTLQRGDTLAVFNFAANPQHFPLAEGAWGLELASRPGVTVQLGEPVPGETTLILRR
jgi:maltooligosyltrehalose trehalohydrolase